MTLVYIFWGDYAGFADALACAKARAGCPIWVISDRPAPKGVNYIPISEFKNAELKKQQLTEKIGYWGASCVARWLVLSEFMAKRPQCFPVFCSDWDILIFRNLAQAYAPFLEFDYTVSISDRSPSAAYAVNAPYILSDAAHGLTIRTPLQAFVTMIDAFLSEEPFKLYTDWQDMTAWNLLTTTGRWHVGNLNEIHNGTLFDHNIHCGEKEFVFDGPSKKVEFIDGDPYFTLLNRTPIMANTIHAWGTYKTRTKELRERAGIPL